MDNKIMAIQRQFVSVNTKSIRRRSAGLRSNRDRIAGCIDGVRAEDIYVSSEGIGNRPVDIALHAFQFFKFKGGGGNEYGVPEKLFIIFCPGGKCPFPFQLLAVAGIIFLFTSRKND